MHCVSQEHLETLIGVLQYLLPDALNLDDAVRDGLELARESFHRNVHSQRDTSDVGSQNSMEDLSFWWHVFTGSLVTFFLLSCVTHFAQYYQLLVDRDDSTRLRKRCSAH